MAVSKKRKGRKQASDNAGRGNAGRVVRIVLALVALALTVFTLVALVSYLFTWTLDQSLAFDPDAFTKDTSAANSGGQLGWQWANLLISKLFGLGAFFVPFFFAVVAIDRLRIRKLNLLRLFFVSIFGAVITSVLLAFVFSFTPYPHLFGNGAGGLYGTSAMEWLVSIIGNIGTGCVLVLALALYVICLTPNVVFHLDDMLYGVSHRPAKSDVPEAVGASVEGADPEIDESRENTGEEYDPEPELEEDDIPFEVEESVPISGTVQEDVPEDGVELVIEGEGANDIVEGSTEDDALEQYDPRLDLPDYEMPTLSLLEDYKDKWFEVPREEMELNKQRIVNALNSYKVKVKSISAKMGPTVTLYKIRLADGVKVSAVRNLEEDIAISLGADGVRVVKLIDSVGIEVANERPSVVALKSVLSCQQFQQKCPDMELPMALGITVTNEPYFLDLAKMPHLLVCGATGQGKSVGLNAIISSILFTKHPSEVKFVMVDPKAVEFTLYEKLRNHYLAVLPDSEDADAVITDTRKVVNTLKSLCIEMDDRYALLKKADVRQLKEYNAKFLNRKLNPNNGHRYMPYIVVVIDEYADLLMTAGREIEVPIARLAQKARAAGIHLILATQRPATNVITGMIKANFISRIAFKVYTGVDSKVILDVTGANRLIGRGDMLVTCPGKDLTRVQCALIDTPEIKRIMSFISEQRGYSGPFLLPEYVDESEEGNMIGDVDLKKRDQLFEDCARLVVQNNQGSTSMLQRKLSLGYARAGKIMDQLEAAGIVGPQEGSKAREVLITDLDALERKLSSLDRM